MTMHVTLYVIYRTALHEEWIVVAVIEDLNVRRYIKYLVFYVNIRYVFTAVHFNRKISSK